MMNNKIPTDMLYGVPLTHYRVSAIADAVPASQSYGEYVGRGSKCMGNDDTCGANRVRGEELCSGHLKQAINLAKLAEQLESEE